MVRLIIIFGPLLNYTGFDKFEERDEIDNNIDKDRPTFAIVAKFGAIIEDLFTSLGATFVELFFFINFLNS